MKYGRLSEREQPWVLAHRGASGRYPENTQPSFAAALEEGAHGFELDVQLTLDEKLVVFHDETLERTTNGTGAIRQQKLAHLQMLDAGSWFHPKFHGAKIPELGEILDQFKEGAQVINVEIKPQEDATIRNKTEDCFVEIIDGRAHENLVVSCFDPRTLIRLGDICPKLQLAALCYEIPTSKQVDELLAKLPHLTAFHLNANKLLSNHLQYPKEIQAAEIPILAWTIDDPQRLKPLISCGISGFFTNYPQRIINAAHG